MANISNSNSNSLVTGTSSADSIVNVASNVTIKAANGEDSITNSGAKVIINAGAGKDRITNRGKRVSILGGSGNDFIANTAARATINAGVGNDSISLSTAAKNNVILYYSDYGNDLIKGFNATSTLRIDGGKGTYSTVKSGSNIIVTVGDGKITLKGAASLSALNISGEEMLQTLPSNTQAFNNSSAANVTLGTNIKNADASSRTKAIKITGNSLDNAIVGGTGNDKLLGNSGYDSILGGKGNDIIWGGTGNDTLDGGAGNDTLQGDNGSDLFIYSAGNDLITDYEAGDKISLGAAISNAKVSGSNVILTTSKGKLTVKNAKQKTLTLIDATGNENQTVISGSTLTLTDSNKANVTLSSAYANASAYTRTKAIKIIGNAQNNSIVGGTKNDTLQGGEGNDTLRGGNGNDKLSGDNGNDKLSGGKGKDLIQGGAGADTLWGGKGNDTLQGGSDSDVFVYNDGDGKDIIVDYKAEDIISIATGIVDSVYKSGDNVVFKVGSGSITVKDAKDQVVTYSEGGEKKTFVPVSPYLLNSKSTSVTLSSSYTKYYGNIFDATAQENAENLIKIDASLVDDDLVVKGNAKNNVIYCSDGNNTIYGGKGNDTIYGGDGSNLYVYNSGDGNDLILDWSRGDSLSIASGFMSADIRVKDDTVILKIGNGKISLQGAAGEQLNYWEDGEAHHTFLSAAAYDNVLEDDNFITSDNLSALVEDKAADYSAMQSDNLALEKNNQLPSVTYSSKK